jgi:hypothetical protein
LIDAKVYRIEEVAEAARIWLRRIAAAGRRVFGYVGAAIALTAAAITVHQF